MIISILLYVSKGFAYDWDLVIHFQREAIVLFAIFFSGVIGLILYIMPALIAYEVVLEKFQRKHEAEREKEEADD